MAVLIALALALGYILAAVPNVEAISVVSFVSGYLLGGRSGAVVGGLSMLLFSVFNPLGPPVPAVLGAQVLLMAVIGSSGHLWRILAVAFGKAEFLAMGFGAVLTFVYSIAADYGFAVAIGRWKDPLPVIAAGLPFSVLHIVSNTLIFGGVSTFIVRKYRLRTEKEHK
ncbi:MAG: hypothetical protein ABIJ00_06320 [Candidatus Eisenbacteria bacterium]